jgi:hypothetical protein
MNYVIILFIHPQLYSFDRSQFFGFAGHVPDSARLCGCKKYKSNGMASLVKAQRGFFRHLLAFLSSTTDDAMLE